MTRHGWPVTPFFETHPITGTFCEFRNTLSSDHFHNGVDIPKPDGSPVYPVYNGVVTSIGTVPSSGDNAFVRVQYVVSGLVKSDAYVHISPNPLLNVGDSVYGYQTVLGTILSGLGHVHFTHGVVSNEINAIRPIGGLTPYIDNYPPVIRSVRFFIDETNTEFLNGRVNGLVDIRVHIAETNAADPGSVTGSTSNNGTYIVGYRILSADAMTVIFEPPSGGTRYRFDRKPSNTYVARVFAPGSDVSTHMYTITNGDGADYINGTQIVNPNAWNSSALPAGNYIVMIFAEDTRGLTDRVYVPVRVEPGDFVAPAAPVLKSVVSDSAGKITVSWYPNAELDLRGYRLYFSIDGTNWTLKDGESVLGNGSTSRSYSNVFSPSTIFFRLAAIDSASPTNISPFSDVYGVRLNTSTEKILIVDGFDRTEPSSSYHEVSHPFAMTYGRSVAMDFNTCANDALLDGSVLLRDYDVVLWVLGDESVIDETFNSSEQGLLRTYLQGGGKLFVSGSEVAYDLDRPAGPTQEDRDFLHTFLKARYNGDDSNEYTVTGASSTVFAGTSFRYGIVSEGSPYEEDWPDYVIPEGGSMVVLNYGAVGSPLYAGIGFKGVVQNGTQQGAVLLFGFPFETITTKADRDTVMGRVFQFFDVTTDVEDYALDALPPSHELYQNYPNPFNATTTITFEIAVGTRPARHSGSGGHAVSLRVFDLLGREVAKLVDEVKAPGSYVVTWDASNLASGVYWYRMQAPLTGQAGNFTKVRSMMVVK